MMSLYRRVRGKFYGLQVINTRVNSTMVFPTVRVRRPLQRIRAFWKEHSSMAMHKVQASSLNQVKQASSMKAHSLQTSKMEMEKKFGIMGRDTMKASSPRVRKDRRG